MVNLIKEKVNHLHFLVVYVMIYTLSELNCSESMCLCMEGTLS